MEKIKNMANYKDEGEMFSDLALDEQQRIMEEALKTPAEKIMEKIIAELKEYMQTVQDFDKDSAQDASALHAYMIELTNFMARANFLMAEYQRKFREEKKAAYLKLMASSHAQQQYWAPSLGKDFIDSQCSESGYIFDLAERTSRLCSHTLSAVVTIVSSLKSERQFANFQV